MREKSSPEPVAHERPARRTRRFPTAALLNSATVVVTTALTVAIDPKLPHYVGD